MKDLMMYVFLMFLTVLILNYCYEVSTSIEQYDRLARANYENLRALKLEVENIENSTCTNIIDRAFARCIKVYDNGVCVNVFSDSL